MSSQTKLLSASASTTLITFKGRAQAGSQSRPIFPSVRKSCVTRFLPKTDRFFSYCVCFSHSFDNKIRKKLNVHIEEHEERGVDLFRYMVHKYKLPITEIEVNLIGNIMLGNIDSNYPKYYFEIVANSSTYFDVDKLDYLLRDSYHLGFQLGFQYDYLFHKMRIIEDQICYDKKAAYTLYSIFNARYKFYVHFPLYFL